MIYTFFIRFFSVLYFSIQISSFDYVSKWTPFFNLYLWMLIEFIFFKLTFYKHNRLEKYYSSISYSLITIIIFLFYFCQFYGYKNWDAPFTIELFKIYFIHINEILSAISINPIYIYLTIIFVFFIFTLINFYSYNRFYNFFIDY